MKLTIDRDALVDVLYRVQGVCGQKATLPILTCCLLEAHEDGRLQVHGSDLEISVSTSCPARVEQGGRLALVAKRLFDTVKSLPSGDVSLTAGANHWANLEAGTVHAKLAGLHPEEFPQLPDFSSASVFDIPAKTLLDMVEKIFFSISTDEARASFTGAFATVSGEGALQMVSTDGHRLSKIEGKLEDEAAAAGAAATLGGGVIIPRKGLAEWRRVMPAESVLKVQVKGDDMALSHEHTRVTVRLIPGRFPNFSQVVPGQCEHEVRVSRELLNKALKRASNYTAKTGNTRLTVSNGALEIHAFDHEIGDFKETVPCSYEGTGISAGYNYRYLIEVLNVIEGDELIIQLVNTESPTVLRDPANPEALFIVMPMQF
jgi:DNA polymerase-3 subunit beta